MRSIFLAYAALEHKHGKRSAPDRGSETHSLAIINKNQSNMPQRYDGNSLLDYKDYTPDVDYSEQVTEPGLTLSMRDIFARYAAQGVNLLDRKIEEYRDDEIIESPDIDEPLDALYESTQYRSGARRSDKRSARSSVDQAKAGSQDSKPSSEDNQQQSASDADGDRSDDAKSPEA